MGLLVTSVNCCNVLRSPRGWCLSQFCLSLTFGDSSLLFVHPVLHELHCQPFITFAIWQWVLNFSWVLYLQVFEYRYWHIIHQYISVLISYAGINLIIIITVNQAFSTFQDVKIHSLFLISFCANGLYMRTVLKLHGNL
jgi:hypothetical protein